MSLTITGLVGVILLLIAMFSGIPISYCMLFVGFWGICYLSSFDAAFSIVAGDIISTFSSYSLSVIPLFIFMGFIAYYSGIGGQLFNLSYKLVGRYRGGLCLATHVACAFFGAVCGSQAATVATMGSIAHPEMRKYNYDSSLSTATVAAGASIGSLIPPSVVLILYGISSEQSIGKLFIGGILPGILLTIIFMLTVIVITAKNPSLAPAGQKATKREILDSMRGGLLEVIAVFVLSLGGLFAGWFTPTEAGAIGTVSLLVLTVAGKKMNWEKIKLALLDSTRLTAMIFLLFAAATIFGRFFALTRIPFELSGWVAGLDVPSYITLAAVMLVYFLLGLFIDVFALILLTVPIFYPLIVLTLGYDPIWFGQILVLVVSMGALTPPVGINVYIIKGVASEVPLETIFKGVWPYVIAILVCIIILMIFPQIATVLPNILI